MRIGRLALALSVVLAPAPAALAGPGKPTKPRVARKADAAKKRSARVLATPMPAGDGECTRAILEDVSIRDLRLVGIVGQGRTQKALLMDASDEASTVTPGECVGIERVPYDEVVKPLRKQLARR